MAFRRTLLVALLTLSAVACSKGPQEQAREKLVAQMGVPWAPGNFLEAAKNGKDDVVALFLDGGIDSESADEQGRTALILATRENHPSTVQTLLQKGADPNNIDHDGKTALIWACEDDHVAVVLVLLKKGINVNAKANDGTTALSAATKQGDAELAKLLVAGGAT
jgi:ankyrin repeat protein